MSSKFEELLDYLVNEEHDKANELFHEIVVEKSRTIYENLIAEEEEEEDMDESMHDDEDDDSCDEGSEEDEESEDDDKEEVTEESTSQIDKRLSAARRSDQVCISEAYSKMYKK